MCWSPLSSLSTYKNLGRQSQLNVSRRQSVGGSTGEVWLICVIYRLIQARYNSQMVLTVSMKNHCLPSSQSGDSTSSYVGCPLTLQRVKTTQFGRANQRWFYDESTGFTVAFSTDTVDKGKQLYF